MAIAKQYLIPVALKDCGLKPEQTQILDDSLWTLIKSYCRESGVRNLQKHIEKVSTSRMKLHKMYIFYMQQCIHRLLEKLPIKL